MTLLHDLKAHAAPPACKLAINFDPGDWCILATSTHNLR